MHPSIQTLVLTLATLAIGGAEGLKLRKRGDVVDTSDVQGIHNILITDAEQKKFYTPMQFGHGDEAVSLYGLVSTTRGDIILPGAYAKNLTGFVSQGKSVAEGPIYAGSVSAGGWTVPDQDIIYYENAHVPLPIPYDGDCAYAGFGIWPNTSTIAQAFGDWSADSLIARILAEPDTGLYWTLLINPLEEDKGTDMSFGGVLTIGEIVNLSQIFNITEEDLKKNNVPDLKLVTEYPYLNHNGVHDGTYYYALIDAISWGSGYATLKSYVHGTPEGKISAYIDSTHPWIDVPYSITEELYKHLEGATYEKHTGLWHLKCTEMTINITIAGYHYPLSPLTALGHVDSYNCVGNFRAKPEGAGGDIVLGVPFLKNVYARFSYQTRRDGEVYDPYVQLMPITDVEDAHHDWVEWYEKWGSPHHSSVYSSHYPSSYYPSSYYPSSTYYPSSHYPTSTYYPSSHYPTSTYYPASRYPSSTYYSTLPYTSSASDPLATKTNHISGAVENDDDEEVKGNTKSNKVGRYLPAIIVGAVVVGLGLIGGIVFILMRRKGRDGKGAYRGLGKPDDDTGPMKVPLYDSEGGSGHYGEGGQGRYTDPYKD